MLPDDYKQPNLCDNDEKDIIQGYLADIIDQFPENGPIGKLFARILEGRFKGPITNEHIDHARSAYYHLCQLRDILEQDATQ